MQKKPCALGCMIKIKSLKIENAHLSEQFTDQQQTGNHFPIENQKRLHFMLGDLFSFR